MSNTNRDYYKRVYNKVNASDELKERLMDMRGKRDREGKKKGRMTWKAAVAAAALVVVVPAGVYAATHWGMNDFFSSTGRDLSKEANKLIETEIPLWMKCCTYPDKMGCPGEILCPHTKCPGPFSLHIPQWSPRPQFRDWTHSLSPGSLHSPENTFRSPSPLPQ